jgi:hypothetical protein
VFTIGIGEEETGRITEAFNCKMGKFPMKYLGERTRNLEVLPAVTWREVNPH